MTHQSITSDVEQLEARFGDPWDASSPTGFDAILRADEEQQMLAAGEALLDDYGLNAEFVPQAYGGRLTSLSRLIGVMRSVFRRDPSLGLGYGASSFLAAANVWTAGRSEQQEWLASQLLQNNKVACAYHELAHGNDIGQAECAARIDNGVIKLNGQKQVIANLARARAMVVYARTAEASSSRSHSLFLVDRAAVAPDSLVDLPRFPSSGMRGIALGGIRFEDCPLPADSLIGESNRGLETALKAFQLTRIALPGMFAGIVDTGLRLTVRHCRARKLYGGSVLDLSLVRTRLVEVFADLLLCDGLISVAANASQLLPAELSMLSAAVKALVPNVLVRAMNSLAALLGAYSYLRNGDSALFQKLARDLQPVGFGHASRISCLMTLLPQLPQNSRRAWDAATEPAPGLFALDAAGAPPRFDALSLLSGGRDTLPATLLGLAEYGRAHGDQERQALAQVRRFAMDLIELKKACGSLRPADLSANAPAASFALAERYATLLAATASIGIWQAQREGGNAFLSQPEWILAVLHRARTLLRQQKSPLPAQLTESLFAEIVQRYDTQNTFDLAGHQLCGSSGWC